jgi:WD40 repeat protein
VDANTAAYSPDGQHVVTGGTKGRVLLWDVATRREASHLAAGHGAVLAARYAPTGEIIALGFEDGTVAVTDRSLATPRVVLHVKDSPVHSVAFSRDGRRIAAALDDGTVRILAADGSEPARRLSGHQDAVKGVEITADGSRAVSAGKDGSVRIWQVAEGGTGRLLYRGEQPETDAAFSPDGSRVLAVGNDGWIRLWNAGSGAEERRVNAHGRQLNAAAFSADGSRFAVGGRDGVTRVWSVAGGPPVAVLRGQRSRVYDVGFGRTSDRVVSAGDDGTVRIWDAGRTQAWTVPRDSSGIDFNRDGRLIATSGGDGTVAIWNTGTGRMQASLSGPDGYTAGKFSPIADTLVIPSDGASRVRIWPVSARSADVVVQLPEGRGMNAARFDATGHRIVYVDAKGRLVVRDLGSGREVTLRGTPEIVYDAKFSPDGRHVAAVTEIGWVLFWRLDRPTRPERVLKGQGGYVTALDYSADGRLVFGGGDRTVRIWDPSHGREIVMEGHQDEITNTFFTAGASRAISSSQDGTLRLWDSRRGVALAVLQSGQGGIIDMELSRDGKIATLGTGAVRVFRCEVCGSIEQVRALALSRNPRPLTPQERQQFLAAVR